MTAYVHEPVPTWPRLSVAVAVAVFVPIVAEPRAIVPDAAVDRPDSPSVAVNEPVVVEPRITCAGHLSVTVGAFASTFTFSVAEVVSPTLSVAVPITVWGPF